MNAPRIYVASLGDYNHGELHGEWIDATQDADAIREDIDEMLENSPTAAKYGEVAEEYAIHDYDGFCGIEISEYADIEDVARYAELIEEADAPELVAHFVGEGEDPEKIPELIQDRYMGTYESLEDYALEWVQDNMTELRSVLKKSAMVNYPHPNTIYMQWIEPHEWTIAKAIANDWEHGGEYHTVRVSEGVAILST